MRKKILFTYTNYSTFVKTDYDILSSRHEVIKYHYKPVKGLLKTALQLFKQLSYLIINIWKFDAVFIWFADYHSFLPVFFAKLLNKKSFVVIGGYDVANFPELKYGSLSNPLRKWLTLFSIRVASLCLPVADELESRLKQIVPKAKTKTVYTGYQFKLEEKNDWQEKRDKIILTVSITNNRQRFFIKGLDRFRELAKKLPDYQFYIVGVLKEAENLFAPVPKNLHLLPPLHFDELKSYYLNASFYSQFSRSEGLPNALCEGMLYGCIPIGLQIGGIPTAIDNLGLVLKEWDYKSVIDFIRKNHNNMNRKNLTNQIMKKFDLETRKSKLIKLF